MTDDLTPLEHAIKAALESYLGEHPDSSVFIEVREHERTRQMTANYDVAEPVEVKQRIGFR